jgi:hypothetical protein
MDAAGAEEKRKLKRLTGERREGKRREEKRQEGEDRGIGRNDKEDKREGKKKVVTSTFPLEIWKEARADSGKVQMSHSRVLVQTRWVVIGTASKQARD